MAEIKRTAGRLLDKLARRSQIGPKSTEKILKAMEAARAAGERARTEKE